MKNAMSLILLLVFSSTVFANVTETAVSNPNRSDADRLLDSKRKPAEVLSFFKIEEGMSVLDVFGGGGYYTEILSYLVGKNGKVTLYNNKPWNSFVTKKVNNRLQNNRLPNVDSIVLAPEKLDAIEGQYDAAMFILGMHDIYYTDEQSGWPTIDSKQFLVTLYSLVKKGGVLGIVDHNAITGTDPSIVGKTLHRIDPAVVIKELESVGFTLEADSSLLKNPKDDLVKSVFDASIKWKTDRSVLLFRK